jgi:hypothetical protein
LGSFAPERGQVVGVINLRGTTKIAQANIH